MNNMQQGIIPGGIYADELAETDLKFLEGRVPYLGQKIEFEDGRKFVFCSTEADLSVGEMVGYATCNKDEIANLCTAAAIGAKTIIVNTQGVAMFGGSVGVLAADRIAGGYLALTDGAGEGYLYRIKSHTAGTGSVSITFTLWDALKVAVTVATDVNLIGPRYRGVIQGTATLVPIGAAVVPTTAATDGEEQYFWVACGGAATCLCSAGVTIGVETASAANGEVADSAEAGSGAYDSIVGTALATTANGYAVIDLRL